MCVVGNNDDKAARLPTPDSSDGETRGFGGGRPLRRVRPCVCMWPRMWLWTMVAGCGWWMGGQTCGRTCTGCTLSKFHSMQEAGCSRMLQLHAAAGRQHTELATSKRRQEALGGGRVLPSAVCCRVAVHLHLMRRNGNGNVLGSMQMSVRARGAAFRMQYIYSRLFTTEKCTGLLSGVGRSVTDPGHDCLKPTDWHRCRCRRLQVRPTPPRPRPCAARNSTGTARPRPAPPPRAPPPRAAAGRRP